MAEPSLKWKDALRADECPALDELFEILGEESPPPEFERHLQLCPRCATEADLYREFERATPSLREQSDIDWIVQRLAESDPTVVGDSPAPKETAGEASAIVRWWAEIMRRPWLPMAAAVLMAVILWTWTPGLPPVDELSDPSILRSGQVEPLSPRGGLAAAPLELKWEGVSGAARYAVRVLDVERIEIWSGSTAEDSIALPAQVRDQMTLGRRFLWEVTALDENGARLGGVGGADFEIRVEGGPDSPRGRNQ